MRGLVALACLAIVGCGRTGPISKSSASTAQAKALLATLPPAYQGADLENGEARFALCRSCHTVERGGGNMTGPNLWGIFGRKAASVAGFAYSDELRASGIVWNAAALDRWITNPRVVAPHTKMTFLGLDDPKDRRDLIAYLKLASSSAAP